VKILKKKGNMDKLAHVHIPELKMTVLDQAGLLQIFS